MSNFQLYSGDGPRIYPTYGNLQVTNGAVVDFAALPVPADGRWSATSGPATVVINPSVSVPVVPQLAVTSQVYNPGTGAPTTGSYTAGELAVDSTGAEFICTASGTPGTWVAMSGGSGGSSLAATAVKTTSYTAAASDLVPVDTTSGAVTVTLPTAPADKAQVAIKHVTQGGTNAVTVACGGSDVFNKTGGATSFTLPMLSQGALLQYKASAAIWYVIADDLPLTQLDARYNATYAPISTTAKSWPFISAPLGWDSVWKAAKAQAVAGTGTAQVAFEGDSITAGQAGGTETDALIYGYVGRLKTLLLAQSMSQYAEFWGAGSLNPSLTAPSCPLAWTGGSRVFNDGGFGQTVCNSDTATWDATITVPASAVGLDLFTIDLGSGPTWQYQVDSAAAVTVTGGGGNSTTGNGHLRRTSISLSNNTTVKIGQASGAAALALTGFAIYYGTTGLGIARNGIQGYRAIDFAAGGGATAGVNGGLSQMADHIKPWSGITDTQNLLTVGFPVGVHLAVIALNINDTTYASEEGAYERALVRMVRAFRAGRANCSIMFVGMCYPDPYSDNSAAGGSPYKSYSYKRIMREVAARHNAAFVDIDSVFGQTPLALGYQASSNIHPTSNGAGAGGGDGHLLIAQTIVQAL